MSYFVFISSIDLFFPNFLYKYNYMKFVSLFIRCQHYVKCAPNDKIMLSYFLSYANQAHDMIDVYPVIILSYHYPNPIMRIKRSRKSYQ